MQSTLLWFSESNTTVQDKKLCSTKTQIRFSPLDLGLEILCHTVTRTVPSGLCSVQHSQPAAALPVPQNPGKLLL